MSAEVVRVAEQRVGRGKGTLVAIGLGSCVAILLYDAEAKVGGLAHVLLPDPSFSRSGDGAAKFATTAVPALLREMERQGADRSRVRARLVGGATMFADLLPADAPHMGERNVRASRAALEEAGISVVGAAVGGTWGRTVRFQLADGRVTVTSPGRDDVVL
ncbi:MAG: chemotaxis protein CheD [Gemmatimonadota bacterium]